MKQAIILHGTTDAKEYYSDKYPSLSNSHWQPWLQKQLLMLDWEVHTPEIFHAHKPTYDKWLRELNRYDLDKDTCLIGHSCGGGFLLRYLTENKNLQVDKVILVAPWLDPDRENSTDMFDFNIDPSIEDRCSSLTIMHSTDDFEPIIKSMRIIKNDLPEAHYIEFADKGHFCFGDMGTREFPELLTELTIAK